MPLLKLRSTLLLLLSLSLACSSERKRAEEETETEHPQLEPAKGEIAESEAANASLPDASLPDAGLPDATVDAGPPRPCELPRPTKVRLRSGRSTTTYGLAMKYQGGGHKRTRDGDLMFWSFSLRLGERRTSVRKMKDDWRRPRNFSGICWRGIRAGWHASSVTVEVAPMCDENGELSKRGCKGAFEPAP